MVVVAIIALRLSVLEWLDQQRMNDLAASPSEWGRYDAEMGRKESNSQYRLDWTGTD
jgi:hypothetical protein